MAISRSIHVAANGILFNGRIALHGINVLSPLYPLPCWWARRPLLVLAGAALQCDGRAGRSSSWLGRRCSGPGRTRPCASCYRPRSMVCNWIRTQNPKHIEYSNHLFGRFKSTLLKNSWNVEEVIMEILWD